MEDKSLLLPSINSTAEIVVEAVGSCLSGLQRRLELGGLVSLRRPRAAAAEAHNPSL